MVFLLGGWGMGDSEIQHHPNQYASKSAHHQFMRQHSEKHYDENEISLIPLGNQVCDSIFFICWKLKANMMLIYFVYFHSQ